MTIIFPELRQEFKFNIPELDIQLDKNVQTDKKPISGPEIQASRGSSIGELNYSNYSCWYCFLSSLDREQDINILKEILFWGSIYHSNDAKINILVPGQSDKKYYNLRNVFNITNTPALVITDPTHPDNLPVEYIKLSKELFDTHYIGENFNRLRDTMEFFNYLLIVEGKLNEIKKDINKRRIEKILSKTWKEIKDVISINVI